MMLAHPSDETLIAYLADTLERSDRVALEAHVGSCESCGHTVLHLSRNDFLAAELAGVESPGRAGDPVTAGRRPWQRVSAGRWFGSLRVLMPVAFAAGLLLAVAVRTWMLPGGADVQVRGVTISAQRSVSQPRAVLRSAPTPGAAATGAVSRGTLVRVSAERDGWCFVSGAGDRSGWLECGALR